MDWVIFMHGVIAASPPVILAVMGETIIERAGVINLSVDGTMILTALTAFAIALKTGSVTAGFAAAGIVGGIVTLLIAYCGIHLKLSQVAVGFVLTLLCRDMAYVLGAPYARIPGLTTTYMPIPILNKLPGIGPILFDHNLAVYSAMIMVPAVWFYFYKTSWGLDLLGLGEQPQAARIRGLPVTMMKYLYCAFGGLLIGLSGALFSLQVKPGWARPYGIEGTGWIVLAIVIFGNWTPFRAAFGAVFFVILQSLATTLQSILPNVPTQVFPALPFPLMIFTLLLVTAGDSESIQRFIDRIPDPVRRNLNLIVRKLQSRPPQSLGKIDPSL